MIDFNKINPQAATSALLNPREIFSSLPKTNQSYNYLRDVQVEVLDQWFDRRTEKDLRIKMNTGGGKTLVGLLLLKSSLNENCGPAVFIAPTAYLATQVAAEATRLGIAVETDPRSTKVMQGRSILVTSINVLLNGKSKFGVYPDPPQIEIGSLVLDDAHACLGTAEAQFTLNIDKPHEVYKRLFQLFEESMSEQSSARLLEIRNDEPGKFALVPFWTWQDRIREVETILYAHKDDDDLKFNWPLLKENLRLCRCVFGNGSIEISIPCLPINMIPSFVAAKRRVFMSATFADDGVLLTHFDANEATIAKAISPGSASDLGERLILIPQEHDTSIKDEDIKSYAKSQSGNRNVVVIVPSNFRAKFWSDCADRIVVAGDLEDAVKDLKGGHVGLVVFVNKYDGVDLPYDACRLLVLDGLPDVRRMIDKLDESCLYGTNMAVTSTVQMIEQGMGRGIRASDDSCAVLLMGRTLVDRLCAKGGIGHLTPATRAQYDLGQQISEQLKTGGMSAVAQAFDYLFSRNPEWVSAARTAVVHAKYDTGSSDLTVSSARRRAFNDASFHLSAPYQHLESIKRSVNDKYIEGWIGFQIAEYKNITNSEEAQKILLSSRLKNPWLPVRPLAGISYSRMKESTQAQAERCLMILKQRFQSENALLIHTASLLDQIEFREDNADQFERALDELADILGFESQRPEKETGRGPDVLWSVGSQLYFVIECKSEAVSATITKTYLNQLAGSVNWFQSEYDFGASCIPIEVHPSTTYEYAATPVEGTRVLDREGLTAFRGAIRMFTVAVSPIFRTCETTEVAKLLNTYGLLPLSIIQKFTSAPVMK